MKNKILVLVLILFLGISSVSAAAIYLASDIEFDNSGTNLKATNLQDAIDEIYEKITDVELSCSDSSAPIIKDKLIPVIISDNGTVKYADTSKDEWYNYCKKQWANAVILSSGSYSKGDTIPESAIESYFVWIPKYKYKLWNVGTTTGEKTNHSIEIIFDTKDTTDTSTSCKTPLTAGSSGNCKNGLYMTHPAFITMGVEGFWVGKFETGYKGATSAGGAAVLSNDSKKIIVKPSVYSWRGNSVINMFQAAYNYNTALNSHMMKNTEWGAVAYLSHSKYGIDREVNIINNNQYKTGYSALLTTQQGTYQGENGDGSAYNKAYNTNIGYLASTTGNISGVYDMSGGSQEYMAAYMAVGSSGFTTSTIANYNAKYFDVYSSSSNSQTYEKRILGDATGEMGPFWEYKDGDGSNRFHNSWYGDYANFIVSTNPWFCRGGRYYNGGIAGQFNFSSVSGGVDSGLSSRLVLAP